MENALDPTLGQQANFVLWCPEDFPDHIHVEWDFWPMREPGLCILFFAASGRDGRDLFDPGLAPREGSYRQYHSGDINALHMSYFRRKHLNERAFCTCNLRKSHGFHLVAQGADPIPTVADATPRIASPFGKPDPGSPLPSAGPTKTLSWWTGPMRLGNTDLSSGAGKSASARWRR